MKTASLNGNRGTEVCWVRNIYEWQINEPFRRKAAAAFDKLLEVKGADRQTSLLFKPIAGECCLPPFCHQCKVPPPTETSPL